MRTVLAALMVMVHVIPAHARGKQRPGAEPQQAADRQKSSREEEKVYKDALGRIPNQKPVDPWSRMR